MKKNGSNKKNIQSNKTSRVGLVVKILIIICILVLVGDILFIIYSQNEKNKGKTFFTSLNAYIRVDKDYYGVGSDNYNNKEGYEKAVVNKYDSKYRKIWSREFKSKYNSTYYNIKSDGDYLLAVGSFEDTKEENKEKLRTAMFVKYDNEGKVVFKKTLQLLGNSKFTNILVLEDSYIVVGQSILPNNVLGNDDRGGAIIIKYSKDGEVIWQKNAGGNKSGLFNDVIKDGDYLYAVGKDATRYGLVAKYTLDGERIKAVSYAKTDTMGFSSALIVDSKLICVGAKKLNEEDEYDHDTDALIVQYNLDLEKKNEATYKDEKKGLERYNKVILDNKKDIVVVGHEAVLDEENSTANENVYNYKSIIVKYDTKLKKKKAVTYDKDLDDYFTDIKVIEDKYVISGYKKYRSNRYKTFFINYSKDLELE